MANSRISRMSRRSIVRNHPAQRTWSILGETQVLSMPLVERGKTIAGHGFSWEGVTDVLPCTDFIHINNSTYVGTWNVRTTIVSKNESVQIAVEDYHELSFQRPRNLTTRTTVPLSCRLCPGDQHGTGNHIW